MAIAGAVYVRIVSQYTDKGSKAAQKDIQRTAKKIDQFTKKIAKSFAIGAAAAGAFALKIGIDAVKGAAADEKAQTSLAIAIRNSTSATEEAIAANTKFLDQLELQVAVDNEELIPALQKLTIATGDLSQAQNLLVLSTDVAVASGKDLGAVTTAISRAAQGNFTALTRLGLPIDQVALKQKDLNKILSDFAELSKGQASAAANTYSGRLKVLGLAYNQVIDKLGFALMPLVLDFVDYLIGPGGLIDALDEWIETNEVELQESLKGVTDLVKLLIDNGDNLTKMLNILVSISGFLNTSILGMIKIGEIAVIGATFGYLTKQFSNMLKVLRTDAKEVEKITGNVAKKATGASTAAKKIGDGFETAKTKKSLGIIRTALGALSTRAKIALGFVAALGAGTLFSDIKGFFAGGNDIEILRQMQEEQEKAFKKEKERAQFNKDQQIRFNNQLKLDLARDKAAAAREAVQKKRDAQELKRQKLLEAQLKKIKSLGVKGTVDEEDPKQLNAAILLLERQKDINAIDKARLDRMKEEVLLLKVRNDLATRYDDILKALADNKITTQEVQILALKWGVATEAVDAYLLQLKIIEDGTISDDEVISLAKSWGSTQAQAAQYLDFFQALNDGILSDAEIEKLKAKWKLTEDQVKMYADFVGVVNDGKLTDAEIIKIQEKWKLTTDQVVDYIKQIGSPVTYSGTLIDPARAAEIGWKNALAALQAYQAALGKGTTTTTAPTTTAPTVPTPTVNGTRTDVAVAEAASKAAAAAFAAAKAAGDSATASIAAAGVTPSALASQESGAIGAASIAAQLRAAELALKNSNTLAQFRDKEAADAMNYAAARPMDYDEKFRFMGSSTMNNASSIVGSGTATSSPTINITVQGSVTSEQDLVQTVRNGLLNTQYNGNSLILQAI
jgi:hypothetical protein